MWLSQGYEQKVTDCQYASYDDCEASEAAGVVCEDGGMLIFDIVGPLYLRFFCE